MAKAIPQNKRGTRGVPLFDAIRFGFVATLSRGHAHVLFNHPRNRIFTGGAHHTLDFFSFAEKNQRGNSFDAVPLRVAVLSSTFNLTTVAAGRKVGCDLVDDWCQSCGMAHTTRPRNPPAPACLTAKHPARKNYPLLFHLLTHFFFSFSLFNLLCQNVRTDRNVCPTSYCDVLR